jgi:GT2 family glycosyltransferase
VVDNHSQDEISEKLATEFPMVRVVRSNQNLGYSGGNNLGFAASRGDYLVILNPDTIVESGWLRNLVDPLRVDPTIGLTTSKIVLYANPNSVNACGNTIHLAGWGFCNGLYDDAAAWNEVQSVPAVSGCSFAIRRELFQRLGGFPEEHFIYLEDANLSIRARLLGFQIKFMPQSVVRHKYELRISPGKFFLLEKNRYFNIFQCFDRETIISLLPALIFSEILAFLCALRLGGRYVRAKIDADLWLWSNRGVVKRHRREFQLIRLREDSIVLDNVVTSFPPMQISPIPTSNRISNFAGKWFRFLKPTKYRS